MESILINGHRDLTADEFNDHYALKIRKANAENPSCVWVIGNSGACDRYAYDFLRKLGVCPTRVKIYHMASAVPENRYNCILRAFDTKTTMNATMLKCTTRDIVWIRPDTDKYGLSQIIKRKV